ncbi:hypothetical protein ACFPVY_09945 [Flavobacterium qiangtangense]|uniref:DUF5723 domain-containing protein n=1 Tax=Flavobacterium qiangtangense TaxID=1442595 RepID=A0ABW1PPU8_9FLAO
MKTKILALLVFFSIRGFSQDSLQVPNLRSQLFSLSPISKKVDNVNGLTFGIGHIDNKKIVSQTINGMNLEVNPAPIAGALVGFMMIMHTPEFIKAHKRDKSIAVEDERFMKIKDWTTTPNLKLNGINLSTGCFFTTTSMNGLNISLGNKFNNFNGISLAPLGTLAGKQNGLSVGIINGNNQLSGATFGIYNQSQDLNGLHFGVINRAKRNDGLQIGVYNKSFSKGFQLGIWNVNSKRSLPLINW